MTPDQLVYIALGMIALLWWLDCAPLYILAGKRQVGGPGWAFVPLVQLDVLARLARMYGVPLASPSGAPRMPWQQNIWGEIAAAGGLSRDLRRWCLVPGPHLIAQWLIALRA